jgi:uncharacterized membrane protein YgcG
VARRERANGQGECARTAVPAARDTAGAPPARRHPASPAPHPPPPVPTPSPPAPQSQALFAAATEYQPSILFVDEADSLLTVRRDNDDAVTGKVKTQFLVEMDGANRKGDAQVIVMAATNRPDLLDEAVRRRFGRRILIPLPDPASRRALIDHALRGHRGPVDVPDAVRAEIAAATEGYSSADLEKVCQAAAARAFQRWIRSRSAAVGGGGGGGGGGVGFGPADGDGAGGGAGGGGAEDAAAAEIAALRSARSLEEMCPITPRDLRKALDQLRPSVGKDDVARHEAFNAAYGWKGEEKDESSSDSDDGGGGGGGGGSAGGGRWGPAAAGGGKAGAPPAPAGVAPVHPGSGGWRGI